MYAACAALNSVNLGYDLGVSTNAGPLLQQDFQLTNTQLELFLGALNFWSIFGALLSPMITDHYGRRASFLTAAVGFVAGIAIMATSSNFYILLAGRFWVGLSVGVGEAIDPMYIAEIAPPHLRGELVSWAEAGVALGVVLGFCSSLVSHNNWRIMLGLGAILPLVMMVLVTYVMPESPRWLLSKHQEREARVILMRLYPNDNQSRCCSDDDDNYDGHSSHTENENENNNDHDKGNDDKQHQQPRPNKSVVDKMVEDIQESLALEQAAAHTVGWGMLLRPSPAVRRMLIVGVGIAIIQQAVGIDAIMFYLMFIIRDSGVTSQSAQLTALIVLGLVKLVFVFVGAKLFDRYGRRPLLFVSLLGCAASLLVVSVTITSDT
jgi:MFS family permease